MKQIPGRNDIPLDDAIVAVRDHEPPAGVAEAAAARVRDRLTDAVPLAEAAGGAIRGCASVQGLFAAHRRGELPAARALLVEDHLHECASCRALFRQPGGPRLAVLPWRPAAPDARVQASAPRRYAVAAGLILAAGLAWGVERTFFAVPQGSRATVQSVSGVLHRVAAGETRAAVPGDEMGEEQAVRTGRGSSAVLRLRDGSLVEMSERAEMRVSMRGEDTTIHLDRGSVIVEAAKRRRGHLLVASKDCTVTVTGTVFSVNQGVKGSRVSVIEGQVRVNGSGGGSEAVLRPGQQWATSAAMGQVPLREELAWSQQLDRHLAMLAEMTALHEKLQAVATPGARHESRLLPAVPAGTLVFASLPNYGEALGEAHRLFEERLRESPVLQDWWSKADPARHGGPGLTVLVDKVRSFADYVGDEVVLALVAGPDGRNPVPLLLAEVRRPGLRELIEDGVPGMKGGPVVHFVEPGAAAGPPAGRADLFVRLEADLVAISAGRAVLEDLAPSLEGASNGFVRTPFGQRVAETYPDGVGVLFAADLQRITASAGAGHPGRQRQEQEFLHNTGFDGLRHLVFERKTVEGKVNTQAVLSFNGPRRGIPSWLASPAAMGTLDFISPNAAAAAAFVVKTPALVLDDLLAVIGTRDHKGAEALAELEQEMHLRVREDLAEALGGEFALALDGPLLPLPAWKLVVEVYDPQRLQASLQAIAAKVNDEAVAAGRPGVRIDSEQVGGTTYHAIRGRPIEVHYAFADGYLVAAGSRALVMRALRTHETGDTLGRSPAFERLFPSDRFAHVSGLAYQNLGPAIGALLDAGGSQLTDEQRQAIEGMGQDRAPTLVCLYGEPEGIRVAGIGGLFDLNPSDLALPVLIGKLMPGTRRRAAP